MIDLVMADSGALEHRVRTRSWPTTSGSRSFTGSRQQPDDTAMVLGPWIPARVMEFRGPAGKARRSTETVAARVERQYEILIGPTAAGQPVACPPAGTVLETDVPILGSPVIELDTLPETLTDGESLIGYLAYGDRASDAV